MRLVFFLVWIVIGFCLFLSGCRASIRAADLEASLELRAAPTIIVEPPEVADDTNRDGS